MVRVEIDDRIATLTVDRPDVRNAIGRESARAIEGHLDALADNETVAALIVTGAGTRAFISGADLGELRQWRRDDGLAARASRLCRHIERFPKPTIAAINGPAVGGGCELALACDLRIAVVDAIFAQPELNLGVIPAAGATQRLPRIIGVGRAMQMILTGDAIDTSTALAWGLVSAVVAADELLPAARALAQRVIARGPLATRLAKLALAASSRVDLDSGLLIETLAQAICFESPDKAEGTAAFLEKRIPRFPPR